MALNNHEDGNCAPFCKEWQVYRKVSGSLFILFKQNKDCYTYAAVYTSSFRMLQPRSMKEKEKFNIQCSHPNLIEEISDKLKYYRYRKSLHQFQVADYIGVDRTTYSSYEAGMVGYPLDKLALLAKLFEIDIVDLLDDYHRFLFLGQGQQVLAFRKNCKLTQELLGEILGVHRKTIMRYEKEEHQMSREVWGRYKKFQKMV